MSGFKFACPVCGQHITADPSISGQRLQCPTCFQKIIIPQAPAAGESKLIISAVQATKPRPTGFDSSTDLRPARRGVTLSFVVLLLILGCALGAGWIWREKILRSYPEQPSSRTNAVQQGGLGPRSVYSVPTNAFWTMEVAKATIPEATATGRIEGSGFFCERAILEGGNLSLRQGPPELRVTIQLPAWEGAQWSGKKIELGPGQAPPLPKVILRWRDQQDRRVTKEFAGAYVLKLVFGKAGNQRIPGRIYLSLPDAGHSFVAGTFDAEIRKPKAPKARPPNPGEKGTAA